MSNRPMAIISEEETGTLWLGQCQAARNIRALDYLGIKTIITAAAEIKIKYPSWIKNLQIPIPKDNNFNFIDIFQSSQILISKALMDGCVLVHCDEGKSRSAILIIAYLMITKKYTYQYAIKYVQERRPILITLNYLKQLQMLEKYQKQQINESLNGRLSMSSLNIKFIEGSIKFGEDYLSTTPSLNTVSSKNTIIYRQKKQDESDNLISQVRQSVISINCMENIQEMQEKFSTESDF